MKRMVAIGMVLLCSVAYAAPVKSIMGAREAFLAGSDEPSMPTAADYVQDGLEHLYDGLENIGYGMHDNDSVIWYDLIGDSDIVIKISDGWHFSDNGLNTDGIKSLNTKLKWFGEPQQTIECCLRISEDSTRNHTVLSGDGNGPEDFFQVQSSGKIFFYVQTSEGGAVLAQISSGRDTQIGFWDFSMQTNAEMVKSNLREATTGAFISRGFYAPAGGKTLLLGGRGNMHFLKGEILSLRLYGRILSEEETAHNYEIDKARFGL